MPLSRCDRALKNSVLLSFSLRHVPIAAAAILRGAAAGDDLQLRATRLPVLGAVGVVQQAHLGNRVEVDHLGLHAAVADFVADDPVDDDLAPVRRQAADRGHVDAERSAHRVDRGGVADPRQQPHQRGDVAPEHLDLFDLRPGDDAAVLRLGRVDMGTGCLDADGVGEAAELERDGADRHALRGAHHHVLALVGAEARDFDADGILSGLQVGHLKVAARIGDGHPGRTRRLVENRHRGGGHDRPLRVDHGAGNRSRDRLGRECR